MQLKEAIEYFKISEIRGFSAIPYPMQAGSWLLELAGREGRTYTMQTARGESKAYSTLDTVAKEVERIAGRISSVQIQV